MRFFVTYPAIFCYRACDILLPSLRFFVTACFRNAALLLRLQGVAKHNKVLKVLKEPKTAQPACLMPPGCFDIKRITERDKTA